MAKTLMNNRIAMHLWIASARQHLAFVDEVREKEAAKEEAREQAALEEFLAKLPETSLEELASREDKYYMSVRVYNSLSRVGVKTVSDIAKVTVGPRLIVRHEKAPEYLAYLRMLLTAAKLPYPEWL
jgi:hypothetical protein